MTVRADVNFSIKAIDQPTIAGATSPAISYDAYNTRETLTGDSTVSVDAVTAFSQALSGGAATIDLTSVSGTTGTQSMDGKSLRLLYVQADSENAGVISIQTGATDGYALFGASGKVTISPGDSIALRISTANDVDATHKTIDLAGTGIDHAYIQMVFG